MYLEAVTVCVNYSDFLAYTLPINKTIFNSMVVVTSPEDTDTQRLCNYHNVQCIKTKAFYDDGASFNKAKGINEGLDFLHKRDWVCHIDADVYLPPFTRKMFDNLYFDKTKIYGIDRLMCPDFESWSKFITKPKLIYENYFLMHLDSFPIAARTMQYNESGYLPIGYFQMFHPQGSGVSKYPSQHDGADRTDVLFCKKWSRDKRELIPEIVGIHLDSENATVENVGKNWNGRKTTHFGYYPIKNKKKRFIFF